MAWNGRTRPGKPEGGEAVAIRGLYGMIAEMAGKSATR
jgi:leucyl aminopeptidase